MSYEKTVWSAGDTITAEKLNNIEAGIEAASEPRKCALYHEDRIPISSGSDGSLVPEATEYGQFLELHYSEPDSPSGAYPVVDFYADPDCRVPAQVACTLNCFSLADIELAFNTPNLPALYVCLSIER